MATNRSTPISAPSLSSSVEPPSVPASAYINNDHKELPVSSGLSATLYNNHQHETDYAEDAGSLIPTYAGSDTKANNRGALTSISSVLIADNLISSHKAIDSKAEDGNAFSHVNSALSTNGLDTKHSAGFFNTPTNNRPTSSPITSLSASDKKTNAQGDNHAVSTSNSLGTTICSYLLPELKDYGQPFEFLMTQNGILLAYKDETTKKNKVGFIKEFSKEYKDFPVLDFSCENYSKLNLIKIKDGRVFVCLATVDFQTCRDLLLVCKFYEIDVSDPGLLKKKIIQSFTKVLMKNYIQHYNFLKKNNIDVHEDLIERTIKADRFTPLPNGEGVSAENSFWNTGESITYRHVINLLSGSVEEIARCTDNEIYHSLLNSHGIILSTATKTPPIELKTSTGYSISYLHSADVFFKIYILKNGKPVLQWQPRFANPNPRQFGDNISSNLSLSPHKDWFAVSISAFDKILLKIFHSPPKLSTPITSHIILESFTPPIQAFSLLWLPDNSGLLYINNYDKCYYVDIRDPANINSMLIGNATTIQFDLNARLLMTFNGQVNCYEFAHLVKTRELLLEYVLDALPKFITTKELRELINQYAGEENSILQHLNFFNPSAIFIFSTRLSPDLNTEMKKLYSEYSTKIIEFADKNATYESHAIEYFYACLRDSSKTIAQCLRETISEYPAIAEGFISKPLKKLFDKILVSDRTHANHAVLFPSVSARVSSSDKTINEHPFIVLMHNLKTHIETNLKNSGNVELRVLKNSIESILAKAVEYKNKKILFTSTINTMLSKILNSINLIQDKSFKLELKEYLNEYKQPLAPLTATITAHAKK